MKKLFILILIFASCKKEDLTTIYPAGTTFNIKGISLESLVQTHNKTSVCPINPFIIDSLDSKNQYADYNYYYCHSANGNIYSMPQSDMAIIQIPHAL